jgi:hypothetical protein
MGTHCTLEQLGASLIPFGSFTYEKWGTQTRESVQIDPIGA